jgi:hypothetical protein
MALPARRYRRPPHKPFQVPTTGHPALRQLYTLMVEQRTTVDEISQRTGISSTAIMNWKRSIISKNRAAAGLENVEACLNVFGYTLIAVPVKQPQ